MLSSPRRRDASVHQLWWKLSSSNPEILTFFEIQYGGRRHFGFSRLVDLARSAMMIVHFLSYVPNLILL